MKKKVFATLLLAGMVLGTGQAAFAEEKEKAEPYQTIDNIDGNDYDHDNGVPIPVGGTLGERDNTGEGENIDEGSDKWIHVTLPTSVAFYTDETDKTAEVKDIKSIEYTITNLSGRPVKVDLSKFEAAEGQNEVAAINSLNLKVGVEEVGLIKDGSVDFQGEKTLNANLTAQGGVFNFGYTGKVSTDKIVADKKDEETKSQHVKYNMNLKFEALQKDGKPVTK